MRNIKGFRKPRANLSWSYIRNIFTSEIESTSNDWDLDNILNFSSSARYSILLLNTPIIQQEYFLQIWRNASLRIAVDGGANRCFPIIKKQDDFQDLLPNIVTGDLDSLHPDVFSFCNEHNIPITKTPDQNKTDFTKALEIARDEQKEIGHVIVYCECYGRLDHTLSNLHTLYLASKWTDQFKVFLISFNTITWLLQAGRHTINIPKHMWQPQFPCGLIPIGHPSRVSTTGLKWNIENLVMQFGDLISSSNEFDMKSLNNVVTVNTSHPLMWTMGTSTFEPSVGNILAHSYD